MTESPIALSFSNACACTSSFETIGSGLPSQTEPHFGKHRLYSVRQIVSSCEMGPSNPAWRWTQYIVALSRVSHHSDLRERVEEKNEREREREETRLEVAMSSERFSDVTDPAAFGSQLHRFEVLDVFAVEEEVADRRRLLVHLERVPRQDHSLGRDPRRVRREERTRPDEVDALVRRRVVVVVAGGRRRDAQEERRRRAKRDREVARRDRRVDAVAQEALKLVHVVRALAAVADRVLAEDRVDLEPPEPLLEHERVL